MTEAAHCRRILNRLGEAHIKCPEMRFGQLVATIGMLAEDETGQSVWDVEDIDFAAALERFARDIARHGQAVSECAAETRGHVAGETDSRTEIAGNEPRTH